MKRAPFLVLFVISLVMGPASAGSPAFGQSSEYYELVEHLKRSQVYASSAVIPGENGTGHVGVSFRVPHALLYFIQADDRRSTLQYRADVEVEVEVYQDGERVARKVWQKEPVVSNYEAAEAPFQEIEGAVWFRLDAGTYRYRLSVTDRIAEQTAQTRLRRAIVPEAGTAEFSAPVLARSVTTDGTHRRIEMYSLSGDVDYGQEAWAVIPLVLPTAVSADSIRLITALRKIDDGEGKLMKRRRSRIVRPTADAAADLRERSLLVRSDTVSGDALVPVAGVEISTSEFGALTVSEAEAGQPANRYLYIVDLRGRELENEHFTFDVSLQISGSGPVSHSSVFASYWREKPFSLYDLDLATNHLSFIADRDVIERLQEGTAREREQKFEAFWKERDPTPQTPFNELMAEYYRRVDYAADEFRTELKPIRAFDQGGGSVPDGLKSDRARVYIVHGPPASKVRENPRRGLVREKWNYDDGRTFIFEALSKFNPFRLVETYKYAGR